MTAFIDEASEIEGNYVFSGTVVLNGRFRGAIHGDGTLIVGEHAVVEAEVGTRTLVLAGQVIGSVNASDRVELKATARLVGEVRAAVVVIEAGGVLDGGCRMVFDTGADRPPAREAFAGAAAG